MLVEMRFNRQTSVSQQIVCGVVQVVSYGDESCNRIFVGIHVRPLILSLF